jgi:hypothetical protein
MWVMWVMVRMCGGGGGGGGSGGGGGGTTTTGIQYSVCDDTNTNSIKMPLHHIAITRSTKAAPTCCCACIVTESSVESPVFIIITPIRAGTTSQASPFSPTIAEAPNVLMLLVTWGLEFGTKVFMVLPIKADTREKPWMRRSVKKYNAFG